MLKDVEMIVTKQIMRMHAKAVMVTRQIRSTVEPLLTDTSEERTPLL